MTSIAIHTEESERGEPRFRAIAGNRQSVGRTMGEALDALTADWASEIQEAAVLIQRFQPDSYFTAGQYDRMQGYRYNYKSGLWEDAGGYERWMGSRGRYKQAYRSGYENGYQRGYGAYEYRRGWYNNRNDNRWHDRADDWR